MAQSEFQIIQNYFAKQSVVRNDVKLGIGDDCAIVQPPENARLALSIDTLVCGVHFPEKTSPDAIAHKALAVNLSDLAAMGAQPAWFTLSLTLPKADVQWLHDFSKSLFLLAEQYNVALIGGDTTHGPLSITIQIGGYLSGRYALQRSTAHIGDLIAVTGPIGAASIGLDIALKQNTTHYDCLTNEQCEQALKALNFPQPRIAEGRYLVNKATAGIDISDGLLADLGHIVQDSHLGAEIDLAKIPLSGALACLTKEQAWERALTGGDDFELCFTISKDNWSQVAEKIPHCTVIGTITEQTGIRLKRKDGSLLQLKRKGYDHFG